MARNELHVRFTEAKLSLRHYVRPEVRGGHQVEVEHWSGVDLDAAVDLELPLPQVAVDQGGRLSFELHDGVLAWARVEDPTDPLLAPRGRTWAWGWSR